MLNRTKKMNFGNSTINPQLSESFILGISELSISGRILLRTTLSQGSALKGII